MTSKRARSRTPRVCCIRGSRPRSASSGTTSAAAGTAAIAATRERDLAREGHHPPRCPAVGLQHAAAADVARGRQQQPLERPDDLRPQLPSDIGEAGADGPLQRADVGPLRVQLRR